MSNIDTLISSIEAFQITAEDLYDNAENVTPDGADDDLNQAIENGVLNVEQCNRIWRAQEQARAAAEELKDALADALNDAEEYRKEQEPDNADDDFTFDVADIFPDLAA